MSFINEYKDRQAIDACFKFKFWKFSMLTNDSLAKANYDEQ